MDYKLISSVASFDHKQQSFCARCGWSSETSRGARWGDALICPKSRTFDQNLQSIVVQILKVCEHTNKSKSVLNRHCLSRILLSVSSEDLHLSRSEKVFRFSPSTSLVEEFLQKILEHTERSPIEVLFIFWQRFLIIVSIRNKGRVNCVLRSKFVFALPCSVRLACSDRLANRLMSQLAVTNSREWVLCGSDWCNLSDVTIRFSSRS